MNAILLVPFVALAGCPEKTDTGQPQETGDSGAGEVACTTPFTSVEALDELNGKSTSNSGPEISPDGLALFFDSYRDANVGDSDIWVATRADSASPWGEPVNVAELNTKNGERGASLTADGLTMYFSSDRDGGLGSNDVWVTTRADLASPWDAPVNVAEVNTDVYDGGPAVSGDGLQLFFSSERSGGAGSADVWASTRPDTASAFDAPENVAAVNTADREEGINVAGNGLSLYFTSYASPEEADIWVAIRADASSAFGAPALVEGVNEKGAMDSVPDLSPDEQSLYFASTRVSGTGDKKELFVATRVCP